jgi:serine palmitoyltransferase
MSTPAVQQTLAALHVLQGKDGTTRGADKVAQLHSNSNFFRDSLRAMGCEVLGDTDSPVMPVMLYNPGKISAFSRECLARHVATVVVGFPATPLLLSRARVCISASHTREELEAALRVMEDVVDLLGLRYRRDQRTRGQGKGETGLNGHHAPAPGAAHLTNGHTR